ncbi:TolC family protein [bacterium]|nr:TolC family protein [bacterium]
MRPICITFLLFLSAPALFCQTLEETVALALRNDPAVSASRESVHAAEAGHASLARSLLPGLSLTSSASVVSERAEIDLANLTGLPLGSVPLGAKENYSAGLNLSYLLFSGFAGQAAVHIGEACTRLTRTALSRSEKETAFAAADAYRSAQGLKLTESSLQAAIARADEQLTRIRALIGGGMALPVDSLTLVLGRLRYEQQLITARSALATAGQKLETLTGRRIEVEPFKPGETPEPAGFSGHDSELLRSMGIRHEIAEEKYREARSAYYPRIAVQAAYHYGKPGIDPITNRWMTWGSAALGLEWKLFQFGSARKQAEASRAAIRQLAHETEQVERELRLVYDGALRSYRSLQNGMQITQRALALAREKFRLITLQAREGMISATEFNEANLELTRAEIDLQEQNITLARKRIELYRISGMPLNTWKFD